MNMTKRNLPILITLLLFPGAWMHGKIKVESADDLPRISYSVEKAPSEIIQDKSEILFIAEKVKTDIDQILEKYEIADKTTLKGYYADLRNIAWVNGDFDAALDYNLKIRELQDKPADKLTSGLSTEAIIEAQKAGHEIGSKEFTKAFSDYYAPRVNELPWEIVQDNIERTKGSMEMYSANLLIGLAQSRMDPGASESGQIDFGIATALLGYYTMMNYTLETKDEIAAIVSAYIESNRVEKPDIWEARSVDLAGEEGLTDVIVAIWDSGVDVEIFEPLNQTWKNEGEIADDGIDNDENGWVDDIYGFAHDLESRKDDGMLFDLPDEIEARYDELIDMSKGLSDVQASIDSKEATAFKKYISSLQPEEVDAFLLDLGYFGNFTHGTHVAGIAAEGNPAIKILTARITFDHKVIPDVPKIEDTVRSARAGWQAVEYMKNAGVRVVNMSWGGTQAGIESAFEANGVGDDSEMRAEMARIMYEYAYDQLVEIMASAPEILFVPAAGNSDEDVEFNKVIPSSISLSNVLVAGAVDQAGDETGFTSYGENVRVHANGFEVDSYLPGGKRQEFSGTSMSAPNVTNLAAKLFAIDPSLTPEQVIDLILLGCDKTEDGRRNLINPKKSIALLKLRNGW